MLDPRPVRVRGRQHLATRLPGPASHAHDLLRERAVGLHHHPAERAFGRRALARRRHRGADAVGDRRRADIATPPNASARASRPPPAARPAAPRPSRRHRPATRSTRLLALHRDRRFAAVRRAPAFRPRHRRASRASTAGSVASSGWTSQPAHRDDLDRRRLRARCAGPLGRDRHRRSAGPTVVPPRSKR